jgi:hypothetical protein
MEFSRRSFLANLAAFFTFGKSKAAPPEGLLVAPAAPPEPKADESKDPGWGPTHTHDWISYPTPEVEIATEVEVCSHPECYAYKVYHHDRSTGSASSEVHEYAPNDEMQLPVIFTHNDWTEMSRHIVAYIDKTGMILLSEDDPMTRRLGYVAFGEVPEVPRTVHWEIPLTRVKNLSEPDPSKRDLLLACLPTQEGRCKLAAAMMGAGKNRRAMRLGLSEVV